MGITLKIDTREQKPYRFDTPVEVGTVPIGDYSISGLEDHIAIERKELNDLIGCLTTGRERFEKELFKSKGLDYFALVIEASLQDIATGSYRSQMLPRAVIQSLMAFSVRYRIPVFFCGSREYGQRITESLLLKYATEIEKRFNLIKGDKNNDRGS